MFTHPLNNRPLHVAALVSVLVFSGACIRRNVSAGKVTAAVKRFNDRFNSSEFHEIYIDADERFRKSVSEADFILKLSELRRQHGPIQSSNVNGFQEEKGWHRLFPPATEFIGYYNHCSAGGFQSLFVFDITGEEAKLVEFETDINDHNKKLQQ
jgi:hypothetical protein